MEDTKIPQQWEQGEGSLEVRAAAALESWRQSCHVPAVRPGLEGSCHHTPLESGHPPGGQAATEGLPGEILPLTLASE